LCSSLFLSSSSVSRRALHSFPTRRSSDLPLGFSIARLELRARGSWFLTTSQGIELLLGRDQVIEKMRRFTAIYQQALVQESENIARIDLRYANGLAVAWHEPNPAATDMTVAAKN